MKNAFLKGVFIGVFGLFSTSLLAQDDLMNMLDEEPQEEVVSKVYATFKGTHLVNANTIETVKAKTLDFRIIHRFGNIGVASNGGGHTLWGLDAATNVRFSFDYGITDRLQVGLGRSTTREHLDFSVKYKILEQTSDDKMPITLDWYSNMAITPMKDVNNYWDAVTDRMSFAHQIILARKFNKSFSFEILPTYFHRNWILQNTNPDNNAQETNDILALGLAGRIKITKRIALIGEYFYDFSDYRTNNSLNPYYHPLGLGVEIETGGHVFHVNLSNASGIIINDFLPNSQDTWTKGGYKFGFAISRVFNAGRK